MTRRERLATWILVGGPILVFSLWALVDNPRLYLVTMLNSLTLASLYFIVASGFTLVFGLMRNVNLAHGSLYLLGGYVGYVAIAAARNPAASEMIHQPVSRATT